MENFVPTFVGDTAFYHLKNLLQTMRATANNTFILTDENVYEHCLPLLFKEVEILSDALVLQINSGEEHKNLQTAQYVWEALQSAFADRNAILINLGGGTVSDIGGFAAGTYRRGIRYINIPTTLLAMVDAALGGKTGVDLNGFKNPIGLFNMPEAVAVFPDFLKTLPQQEILSGSAEILKTGLIGNNRIMDILYGTTISEIHDWDELINLAVGVKNQIVTADYKEENIRKYLNFGHTAGHAFESYALSQQKTLLHGEAVAMGMIVELFLSVQTLNLPQEDCIKATSYILNNFPYFKITQNDVEPLVSLMMHDKKNTKHHIRFVLLEALTYPMYDQVVEEEMIYEALAYYMDLENML